MSKLIDVFASDHTIIKYQAPCGNASDFWVTFSGFETREPTAAGFIRRDGAGALHVINQRDDWFQTFDLHLLQEHLTQNRPAKTRLILFGSSMGAFASLAFSERLKADLIIVGGPQVIVDVDETQDKRWVDRWRAIKDRGELSIPDARPGMSKTAPCIVFFDPWVREDRWHARLLSGHAGLHLVPLRGVGHPVFYYLMTVGLWAAFMQTALVEDTVTLFALARVCWKVRRKDYHYLCTLGMTQRERGHHRRAVHLYRRAGSGALICIKRTTTSAMC